MAWFFLILNRDISNVKNTQISEMCFRKLSLPRAQGGRWSEWWERGNERLEKKKERWTDRKTDSKRMTERQTARQTKTHYAEEQKAVTKLVQRMTNDALKSPNWEPEGIRVGSDISYFGSWLSEQKKNIKRAKNFTKCSSYYTSNIHIVWMHILYFYPAEVLARPSQAVWHSRGVDVLFRQ